MKKIVLFAALLLVGAVQIVNAQDDTEYSLEGIGKTLSELNVIDLKPFHEGLAKISTGSWSETKYGFIDKKGNIVVPCIYDRAGNFYEGLAMVWKKGEPGGGYIDKNGNILIPFEYGSAIAFSEGLAFVYSEKRSGYINKKNELVIPFEIKKRVYPGSFQGGVAPIFFDKQEGYVETYFIDKKGNTVISSKPYKYAEYVDGFYKVRNETNRKYELIDTKGNVIIPAQYKEIGDLSEGLLVVNFKANEWGYVNLQGKAPFPDSFNSARPFSEGLAAVKIEKKWGYINKQGKIEIPLQFKEAYDFHNGFAFVETEERYAIINKEGNIVHILPKYEYFIGKFTEGLAIIKQNDKWGYVDFYGNSTFNPNCNPNAPK